MKRQRSSEPRRLSPKWREPTTTAHQPFSFIGGDDWEIQATLQDENGNPYDLTNAQILWTLTNAAGQRVLDPPDISISVTDAAAGTCSIMVAAAKTSTIPGGRYNDALRIVTGGITSTLSAGPVQVVTDPWLVATRSVPLTVVARRA
jgi:hypothetical protein